MRNYKPATFQPIIRPDWGGALSYMSTEEKAKILTAIIKYPSVECDSVFWQETIKPDIDAQFDEFKRQCELKSRGIRERWGKTSITSEQDLYNTCNRGVIDSEREKEKEKESKCEQEREHENECEQENKRGVGEKENTNTFGPTLDEVLAEAALQNSMAGAGGYKISQKDAEIFYTTYAPTDWCIHNEHHTPIRNWKAALRGWAIKKERERLDKLEKDGIPSGPRPFRDDSGSHE